MIYDCCATVLQYFHSNVFVCHPDQTQNIGTFWKIDLKNPNDLVNNTVVTNALHTHMHTHPPVACSAHLKMHDHSIDPCKD